MVGKTRPVVEHMEAVVEEMEQPPTAADPLEINVRLYRQIGMLLGQLEEAGAHITLRERVQALIAVGRIQVIFMGLRKEKISDSSAGSSVRKYAKAFKTHDTRGRKAIAGRAPEPDADDTAIQSALDDAWGDGDDERDTA